MTTLLRHLEAGVPARSLNRPAEHDGARSTGRGFCPGLDVGDFAACRRAARFEAPGDGGPGR